MATVTETRISVQVQALARKEEEIYFKYFPAGGAYEGLWVYASMLDTELGDRLKKRPIGIMEIKRACREYAKCFEEACIKAKANEQQARAADQEGGEATA